MTPLFLACFFRAETLTLLLLSRDADPNKLARWKSSVRSPLYEAVANNWTEMVRSLLASGARQDLDTAGGEHYYESKNKDNETYHTEEH